MLDRPGTDYVKTLTDPQEIFDYVLDHLRLQGGPSGRVVNDMTGKSIFQCEYRGPQGKRCAVGWLIADEDYERKFEGTGVAGLADPNFPLSYSKLYYLKPNLKLLNELQKVHDADYNRQEKPEGWVWSKRFERNMQRVAADFELTYTPPVSV